MINRLATLALLTLTACAMQEEMIMVEEPMIVEEDIARMPNDECEFGDDDGIGGTGCEPVARRLTEP
ncbi:MAG: hypothetical protein HKN27_00085 [Silicimonas sp.]|nr:hypothetical protein [Silicimonas sp.]